MTTSEIDVWLLALNSPTSDSVIVKQTESYISLRQELTQLRMEYVNLAKPDVGKVRRFLLHWDRTSIDGRFDEILSLAHSLRGTAAAYGFAEVGTVAAEIEEALRFVRENQVPPADCDLDFLIRRWDAAAVYNGLSTESTRENRTLQGGAQPQALAPVYP
jgi:chemotaxis protein histidine kinase CheA